MNVVVPSHTTTLLYICLSKVVISKVIVLLLTFIMICFYFYNIIWEGVGNWHIKMMASYIGYFAIGYV